ncbi:MAG TPA: hypothetical protein VM890_15985 [Longimicrobium sp.]|nr:hypothetical protein [Longimicrobium sp.]
MTRILVTAAAAVILAAPAFGQGSNAPAPAARAIPATPFGLRMGMTVRDLAAYHPVASERVAGLYTIRSAPAGQPEFDEYMVLISPRQGVCKVVAIGRRVSTGEFGEELRAAFDRLERVLTPKYGDGNQMDDLKEGSLWTEPRDWMRSLRQHDRTYQTLWRTADGDPLPPNLASVQLEANASSSPGVGFLVLGYEFSNFHACRDELNAGRGNAF